MGNWKLPIERSAEPAAPYKMATIARLTSFSPQRLRAWERRYELLRPQRGPGGHRLYGRDDLRVLLAVRELLDAGRSIGEINDIGRRALLGKELRPSEASRRVEQWTHDIVEAAQRMDERTLQGVLDDAFGSLEPEHAVERVVLAAQRRIGALWSRGQCTIASEHMATGIFVHRLRSLVEAETAQAPPGALRVLGACLPGERHELGLLAVGYSLAIRGARTTMLGADLPFPDLREACTVLAPRAILLSVSGQGLFEARKTELLDLREQLDATTAIVLGGSGAPLHDLDLEASAVMVMSSVMPPSGAAQSLIDVLQSPGFTLAQSAK